ncbi:MAG: porin family protein [Dysgonamonadaceae bacterium]|nr:porin family protein [Dysgonamonadaceae bacterium]
MFKKFVILVVAVFTASSYAQAQESYKPASGDFSVEVGVSPFSEDGPVVSDGSLTGTYFISEKWAVRLELGLDFARDYFNNGEKGYDRVSVKEQTSVFALSPGISYYFSGTDRLSPFIGGALLFANSYAKETTEQGNYSETKTLIENGESFTAFGLGVYTGFDYYIAKKIYLGIEVGLIGVSTSIPTPDKSSVGAFNLSFAANPSIRLGYSF